MSNNATSTPEPGQILAGKYLIEKVLGIGGMGVVVAAKHVQLDQKVAIKYLLPAALLNPEVVERFAREARAAAKIRGEHVARVIDVGQFDDGAPFMVMEHLEGHDLQKHLELHAPLAIEDVVRYLLETCEALAEAHAAKIVHRDLKPSNMFLAQQPDRTTIIKVLDFGISKTGEAPSAALTKTSALMGTAFYMSPEQLINPKGVDHRSDIWTLGVIMYELFAGRQPFLGESVPEIIGGILQNEPEGLRTLRSEVPVGLEAVIAKCMKSKPNDRYQSVAQLAAALGPFARDRDRSSIETISRVLGESLKPQPITAQATVLTVQSPTHQTGPNSSSSSELGATPATLANGSASASESRSGPASGPGSAPVLSPHAQSVVQPETTGTGVPAVTTHGLSTSSITTKPAKRSPLVFVGVALLIGAVCTGVGVKLSMGHVESTSASAGAGAGAGMVAPPPPAADPAPPSAAVTAVATTPAPSVAVASAAPVAPVPAPTEPVASPASVAVKRTGVGAAAPAPGKVGAGATPAPPPPIAVVAPAPASAAPAPAPSKNPLNMGIK